jgi:hypothetical protein
MTTSMTYAQLLDRIISDGIAAARADYADKPDHLRGAVEGFEACRDKTVSEIVALYASAARQAHEHHDKDDYWYYRCIAFEIEWVLNVLSVGLSRPLLGHLPTARGAMKYAEIFCAREHGEVLP